MDIKVCPQCYSQNTSIVYPNTDIDKWEDICNNCGYVGTMIIMDQEAANKLKVKHKKSDF